MSVYLKKKRSYNLVGWWSVDFLLIEMKTLLILKEKPHLYSFIHSSAIWCVLEFHGLYRPWGCKELDTTERLSFSLSLYRVLGSMDSTEREQTWSFPMSLWFRISHKWNHTICTLLAFLKPTMVFLQLSMVLHVPPSFFKLCHVSLCGCVTVGWPIHLLMDVWVVSSSRSMNKALMIIHGQVVWCPLCSFLLAVYLGVELLVIE